MSDGDVNKVLNQNGTSAGTSKNIVQGTSTTALRLDMADLTIADKGFSQRYKEERETSLKKFSIWNEREQTDFLKVLLQNMNHHQHGLIDQFFQPMLKRDFVSLLPEGLEENVLSLLDAKSLLACAAVSKTWRHKIANCMLWRKLIEKKVRSDSLWKGLGERRGWNKYLFVSKEQASYLIALSQGYSIEEAQIYSKQSTNLLDYLHEFYCHLYHHINLDIAQIEENWRTGKHRLQRINCESENNKGVYCLQYDDSKIISGLRDNTIKVWRRSDLTCTSTLVGHTGSVLCLQYDDKVIASGSSDATVRIWDVNTGLLLNTLVHHCEAVLHLRFHNGMLVTCSKDRSIAVWDMSSPTEIDLRRVLVGHRAAVNVVDFDDTYIVSASGDRTIKVWSADTCEFVRTLNGHRRGIACLQYRDRLVVSGSSDNSIRLWDIDGGNCLRVLEGHEELVRCIRFDSKRIVSGAYDGKLKVWDLTAALDLRYQPNAICLNTLIEHTGRVFRLQFDDFQIVSSSHDDTILIWDFLNTGNEQRLKPINGRGGPYHNPLEAARRAAVPEQPELPVGNRAALEAAPIQRRLHDQEDARRPQLRLRAPPAAAPLPPADDEMEHNQLADGADSNSESEEPDEEMPQRQG